MEAPAGWEEVGRKQVDGLEVVIRHKVVLGEDCLEGSATAPLSPDALLAAATDVEGQPAWSTWKVPAARRLTPGAASFDYYQVLDNPSPVADRYWFVHARVSTEGADRIFRWDQVDADAAWPAAVAEVRARFPDAVSTRTNLGDWTFTPEGATTRLRYRICTDAGGNIPRWVGEFAARSTLPTNLSDIVKEVGRR